MELITGTKHVKWLCSEQVRSRAAAAHLTGRMTTTTGPSVFERRGDGGAGWEKSCIRFDGAKRDYGQESRHFAISEPR